METPRLGPPGKTSVLTDTLKKIAAIGVGVAMLIVALMFSAVLFSIGLVVLLLFIARVAWTTRHLRKQMREHNDQMRTQMGDPAPETSYPAGRIIEGEVIRDPADPKN